MSDIFQIARDHIEAFDSITQEWQTADGTKTITQLIARPAAWIERVHERGVLTALDCLAIIVYALDDWYADVTHEQRKQLATGWAAELQDAARAGEIQSRDPFTLLPLKCTPEGWKWGALARDVDKFLNARGIDWKCGEIAAHIYTQVLPDIEAKRFPLELRSTKEIQAAPVSALVIKAPAWEGTARNRAVEIIERQRKKDLYPSQTDIADEIAKEFRAADVVGAGGKPLTGAYIKRHALKGISSEQGKHLSTSTRRGK